MDDNKVLVIDDDSTYNLILKRLFTSVDENLQIDKCQNVDQGIAHLDYLKENNLKFPKVVLVDINMPVKDGYDFVEEFEKNFWKNNKDCSLYFVSTTQQTFDIDKALGYASVAGFYEKTDTLGLVNDVYSSVID